MLIRTAIATIAAASIAVAGGFVRNDGQFVDASGARATARFVRHGTHAFSTFDTVSFSSVLVTTNADSSGHARIDGAVRTDIVFLNARSDCAPEGLDTLPGARNYYLAHCPNGITGVPAYARVVYRDLYPGIDLVFYERGDTMEYDWRCARGADPARIAFAVRGATPRIDVDGSLVIATALGVERHSAPVCEEEGTPVAGRFAIHDGVVSIDVPAHDPSRALRIDPTIVWSTYEGGTMNDVLHNVAFGLLNRPYVTGFSWSANFPTTAGTAQRTIGGQSDIVVERFDSNGALDWATFYGGNDIDVGIGLTVDRRGACWVTGDAASINFPLTADAAQKSYGGGSYDGFLLKLSSSGLRLYATFVGGGAFDGGTEVAADAANDVAVTGLTASDNFPVTPGCAQVSNAGNYDMWVMKVSEFGTVRWTSYLGGKKDDRGRGLALDPSGNIILGGFTNSVDFPTVRAAQGTLRGTYDACLAKFTSAGALVWSTYFGGSAYDAATRVKCNAQGDVFVEGVTSSGNLATPGVAQPAYGGGTFDAFVARLDSAGTPRWCTYAGGTACEDSDEISYFSGLTLGRDGAAYITGRTSSANWPGRDLLPTSYNGGAFDAFVARVSGDGTLLERAWLGGSGADEGHGIAADSASGMVVVGSTTSADFRTSAGAFQPRIAGAIDGFVVRIAGCNAAAPMLSVADGTSLCQGDTITITVTPPFARYVWSDGSTGPSLRVTAAGTYSVSVIDSAGCTGASNAVTIIDGGPAVTMSLQVDTASGQAGDTIRINIILTGSKNLASSSLRRLRASLRFNGSLLMPVDIPWMDDGAERVATIDVTRGADSIGVLCTFTFIAALGDTDWTRVSLDSMFWQGPRCSLQMLSSSGWFHLTNVCHQGGSRFFTDTPPIELAQNVPNPVHDRASVGFTTIEPGYTTLTVYDMLGRAVAVPFAAAVDPGAHTAFIDARAMAAGTYVYELRTPTQTVRRMMEIAR